MSFLSKRPLAALLFSVCALPVFAQEATIKSNIEAAVGAGSVQSVAKAGYGNLYEVVLNSGEILYADERGSYFLGGPLIDLKAKRNVTQARSNELARINFADLPLTQAVKQVRGSGKHVLATFEDPNCGYCKKLAKDMTALKDVTVYTFLLPILTPDSAQKSRNIWCASDRAKAWSDWMVDGKTPADAAEACDAAVIDRNLELGRKLRISGTPTLFLADGSRIGGYVSLPELEKAIAKAAEAKPAEGKPAAEAKAKAR